MPVTLINDSYQDQSVTVRLMVATESGQLLSEAIPFQTELPGLGRLNTSIELDIPSGQGFVIYASIEGEFAPRPIYSRRKVNLAHPGVLAELPSRVLSDLNKE